MAEPTEADKITAHDLCDHDRSDVYNYCTTCGTSDGGGCRSYAAILAALAKARAEGDEEGRQACEAVVCKRQAAYGTAAPGSLALVDCACAQCRLDKLRGRLRSLVNNWRSEVVEWRRKAELIADWDEMQEYLGHANQREQDAQAIEALLDEVPQLEADRG